MAALIGHRGARALFPENTLEGFAAARALGLRHFEIDIALTADGVPVLSHDPCLNPDLTRLDGVWLERPGPRIRDLTFAELSRYDVGRIRPGSATAAAFPRQTPADGARIPALRDVLAAHPGCTWTIELKTFPFDPALTAAPEAMADAVHAVCGAADVIVQSFDWRGPRHLRRRRPDRAYAWLTAPETCDPLWWGCEVADPWVAIAREGGGTWAPHHASLTEAEIAAAHAAGLRVVPWTVNDAAAAARLLAWGADALITDDPVALS